MDWSATPTTTDPPQELTDDAARNGRRPLAGRMPAMARVSLPPIRAICSSRAWDWHLSGRDRRSARVAVIEHAQHRYTRKLIQAVPIAVPRRRSERRDLTNEEFFKFGAARRLRRAAASLPRSEPGSCRTGIALILAAGDRLGHRGRACVAPPRGRGNALSRRCRAAFQPRNALHGLDPVITPEVNV
jgi:hypothetical protein